MTKAHWNFNEAVFFRHDTSSNKFYCFLTTAEYIWLLTTRLVPNQEQDLFPLVDNAASGVAWVKKGGGHIWEIGARQRVEA